MTLSAIEHQNWNATMWTPIPNTLGTFDGSAWMEGYRSQVTSALQSIFSASNFVANATSAHPNLAQTQHVTVSNISFPKGSSGFVGIQFTVDTYTDPTLLDWVDLALFGAGLASLLASIFAGPIFAIIGIVLLAAAFTLAGYLVYQEVLNCSGSPDIASCLAKNVLGNIPIWVLLGLGGLALVLLLRRPRSGGGGITIIRRRNGS